MKEPKIRFKGFCGEWENHSLKEKAFAIVAGGDIDKQSIRLQGKYPVIANALSNDGIVGYYDDYYRIEAPAVSVTGRGEIGHAQARKNSFTPVVRLLSIQSYHDVDFLANAINCKKVVQESTGVPQLTTDKLSQYEIAFPEKIEEEKAIGNYISSIDTLIQSTTKKIESLKQVKTASLQSMFPQEGETKPRVRFKGFEGEWEKVGFGNIFGFIKNNSFSRDLLSDANGEVKNIHYGDVLIKFGDIIDISKDKLPYIKGIKQKSRSFQNAFLQDGDVVITDAAEDSTVGKCSEILHVGNEYVVAGLHTIPCRPIIPFAFGYLGHYINSDSYHNQLLPLIQGSKISSISKTVIKLTMVMFPSFAEQQKIASYFTNLDSQITLQTQRLEKLKQIKSACLDNMFV